MPSQVVCVLDHAAILIVQTLLLYLASRLLGVREMRYLGIFLTRSRVFSCSINSAKRSFYRCANAIFGKVGKLAAEKTILQLIKTKCVPMLLYGLEVCPLKQRDIRSLDFCE